MITGLSITSNIFLSTPHYEIVISHGYPIVLENTGSYSSYPIVPILPPPLAPHAYPAQPLVTITLRSTSMRPVYLASACK